MKGLIAAGAIALIASTQGATALSTTINLTGFCQTFTVKIRHGLAAMTDVPACNTDFGGGLIGKTNGFGKSLDMATTNPQSPGAQYMFEFSYPLTDGGTWNLYATSDGVNFSLLNSGSYSIVAPGERSAVGWPSVLPRRSGVQAD